MHPSRVVSAYILPHQQEVQEINIGKSIDISPRPWNPGKDAAFTMDPSFAPWRPRSIARTFAGSPAATKMASASSRLKSSEALRTGCEQAANCEVNGMKKVLVVSPKRCFVMFSMYSKYLERMRLQCPELQIFCSISLGRRGGISW